MKYLFLAICAILITSTATADKICVTKKPRVTAAGRVNMVKAIRFTTEDCTSRQFELAIPEEPVKTSLPSGETITGFYSLGGSATAGNQSFMSEIDFSIPLDAAPSVEIIEKGEDPTDNCPGTASAPTAMPGFLCVYEGSDGAGLFTSTNRQDGSVATRNFAVAIIAGSNGATANGATISALSIDAGFVKSAGTWAVTAP